MSDTDAEIGGRPVEPATDATAETPLPDVPDTEAAQASATAPADRASLTLRFHAVSDVGRVRKDNQDSGYAGPWLLSVCDGVGGAARGDIASSTAVSELRHLDIPPAQASPSPDLVVRVSDGLHEAQEAIGAQVDQDPSLKGTSTTAVLALFDGARFGFGHVGDSRAYLLREGRLTQLTTDHTFVQSLVDEGRITEEEARVHPHRNLILQALDGQHDVDPDLFQIEAEPGDRLFLCSDGACGVLDNQRIGELLADGTPEFTAIELVRASLDAGSSDNVTCIVADVVVDDGTPSAPAQVVGAAADLKRRLPRALFRGHRSGDTGELEPVTAEIPGAGTATQIPAHAIRADPPYDSETLRYAPRPPRRFVWTRRVLGLCIAVGVLWMAAASAYWWTQRQYFVGDHDGKVAIFRGVDLPHLSHVYQTTDLEVSSLTDNDRRDVEGGKTQDSLSLAKGYVQQVASNAAAGSDAP